MVEIDGEKGLRGSELKELTLAVQRHMQAIKDLGHRALDPRASRKAEIFYYFELEDWHDAPELKPKDI